MIAEVSLSASGGTYAAVADRPLSRWWSQVQPFVRTVLLAPQPPGKVVDRVSWSWTQGAKSITVSRQEMLAIRRALEESAAALIAAVPKEPKLRTVFDAYAGVLRALASRSNSELERYVCVTPFGPMLHSWGSSVAAIPRTAPSADLEISGTVVVMGKPEGGHQVILIDSRGSTIGRSRSDGDGHFRFASVASGRYRLRGVSDRVDFPVTGLLVDLEDTSVENLELKSSATRAIREEESEANSVAPELSVPAGEGDAPTAMPDRVKGLGKKRRGALWIVTGGGVGLVALLLWLIVGSDRNSVDGREVSIAFNPAPDQLGNPSVRSTAAGEGRVPTREVESSATLKLNRLQSRGLSTKSSRDGPRAMDGREGPPAEQAEAAPGGAGSQTVLGSAVREGSGSESPDRNSTAALSSGSGFVSKRGGGPARLDGVVLDATGAPSGPRGGGTDAMAAGSAAAMAAPNAAGNGSSAGSEAGGSNASGSGAASVRPATSATAAVASPASGSLPVDAASSASAPATPPPARDAKAPPENKRQDRAAPPERSPSSPSNAQPPRDPLAKPEVPEAAPDRIAKLPLDSTSAEKKAGSLHSRSADPDADRATAETASEQNKVAGDAPRTGPEAGPDSVKPDQPETIRGSPTLVEPSVATSGEGSPGAVFDPERLPPDSPLLAQKVRVRMAPWKSILVQDQIVATTPQPIDSPDESEDRRRELFEQQRKLLPDDLAYSVRWQGIGLSFPSETTGEWLSENGAPVVGGRVGAGTADIGWRESELASNREIHWVSAHGREVTVTTTQTGEILVAARDGLRVWFWVAVEPGSRTAEADSDKDGADRNRVMSILQDAVGSGPVVDPVTFKWARRVQWRALGSDSRSSLGWRTSDWRDGRGRRLEMPLIADAGAQTGARLAWVDEDTGWALMTTVWLTR